MSSEHYTSSMSLESLLQEPYNAYQQADYDILETALEDALHAVLDWNAVRHANKGHFEKAMASALKLILMYPNSASGYLHAGGIQAELCDYRQAARYYARGVAAGVQHPDLKARLEAAQRRRDGLIDPVDALPGEVISKIFEYAPEKRVLCTRLSKRWRAVLLNLPMWHTLDIRLINVASHGYWQQGLDHYLKPHLQRLFLRTNSKICLATSALNGAQCRNIQTIEIVDNSPYDPDRSTDGQRSFIGRSFFRDVASISETLTRLSILSSIRPRNVLRIVLSLCPKLVYLSYEVDPEESHLVPAWDTTYLPPPSLTDLRYLTWPSVIDLVTDPSLIARHCPQLTFLHMCDYEDDITDISALVDQISKNCPRLQLLDFSTSTTHTETDKMQRKERNRELQQREPEGLTDLIIGTEVTINTPALRRLIKSNQTSLERFLYELEEESPRTETEPPLTRTFFDLPRMHMLSIHTQVPATIWPLHTFIGACPVLEVVSLSYIDISQDIMQALAERPLRKLKLSYCDGNARNTSRFLRGLIEQDSKLVELELRCHTLGDIWDEEVFITAGRLAGLKRLHLSSSNGTLGQGAIRSFLENAANSGLVGTLKEFYCPARLFPNTSIRNTVKDFFGPAFLSSPK